MAKNKGEYQKTKYDATYKQDYLEDWDIHRQYIQTFDPLEAMLLGQVWDSVSQSVDGSKITDSYTMTLAKERADRVMAKLPDGETEGVGKGNAGKGAFLDILRQKWIYPNANAQRPFFEKLNLWQLYSSVYGYMPMFYDWNVSNSGYVGPDCWLWNPRNLVPQQGRVSIEDMDYTTGLTWVSKRFLTGIINKYKGKPEKERDGWILEAVQLLLDRVENERTDPDTERDTVTERTRISQSTKRGVCLATRYESGFYDESGKDGSPEEGRWCFFAPDHGCLEVRTTPNPHKNGRIPYVIKYSQPLFDSFYGLGHFQRAKPLQFARDGLNTFYFKGIKMNLIPPMVVNANGVLKHTIDYREGAVMMETIPNSIRRLETSTAGLATYQAAQSQLTGSLLSLYGTQNASLPASEALNPSQGKTPAAIGLYGDKEATQDGAERRHLEVAIEQLVDGFNSLIANIGTEEIPVTLFAQDIKDINDAGLTDVLELFTNLKADESGYSGEFKINPEKLRGIESRFHITPNSTARENKEQQLTQLERIMTGIGKFQNIIKDDPRIEINWASMLKSYEELAGLKGAVDFITVKEGPSPEELALMEENQQLQQQLQQVTTQVQADETARQEQQMMSQAGQMPMEQRQEPSPLAAPSIGQGLFRDPDINMAAEAILNS